MPHGTPLIVPIDTPAAVAALPGAQQDDGNEDDRYAKDDEHGFLMEQSPARGNALRASGRKSARSRNDCLQLLLEWDF